MDIEGRRRADLDRCGSLNKSGPDDFIRLTSLSAGWRSNFTCIFTIASEDALSQIASLISVKYTGLPWGKTLNARACLGGTNRLDDRSRDCARA
jgi:hypothetical protein